MNGSVCRGVHTHTHTHAHTHTPVISLPEHALHYTVKLFRNENVSLWLASCNTVQFDILFVSAFLLSIHLNFNTTLLLHMEASFILVIAGYVGVKSLIRTRCSEHYVYIFHVSPCGNQSSQWPTHGHPENIFLDLLYTHTWHKKQEGWHLLIQGKFCSLRWELKHWSNWSEGA